jgi:2-polyprenyl-3-methyl-5-hydroxy-6-metoxy-1,4-benzoquinol methylase
MGELAPAPLFVSVSRTPMKRIAKRTYPGATMSKANAAFSGATRRSAAPGAAGPSARHADSWEHVADWYEALAGAGGTEFHQQVIIPGLLRLLALKPGDKVCDLACGQGAVTMALAGSGAQVTGVDLSPPGRGRQ